MRGFFDTHSSTYNPPRFLFQRIQLPLRCGDGIAANRYNQLQLPPKIEHTQKSLLLGGILHGIKPIFQNRPLRGKLPLTTKNS